MALSQISLMVLLLCLDIRVCNKVYCIAFFFKIPNVAERYQGLTIKALITTRWSGHFSAMKTIKSSYTQLVDCLANVTTSRIIKPGHHAVGRGLLDFLEKKCTMFLMHFMYDVLQLLDILVQTFQQTSSDVTSAFKTFQSIQKELKIYQRSIVQNTSMIWFVITQMRMKMNLPQREHEG